MATIRGTARTETINGTTSSDTIYTGGGDDTVYGNGGNDHVIAYTGNVTVVMGGRYISQYTIVETGTGNDTIQLSTSVLNIVNSGEGNDTIYGTNSTEERITTGGGDDLVILGGGGKDTVSTGSGADTVNASGIYTSLDIDTSIGNDVVMLGNVIQTALVNVGDGDDVILLDQYPFGYNKIAGGAGFDIIAATQNNATLNIASISGIEMITSQGRAAFDITLDGGKYGDPAPSAGSVNVFDFSATQLVGVRSITGSSLNEAILMNGAYNGDNPALASNDRIASGGGDDLVHAGYGHDIIDAGTGNDTVYGGGGSDLFFTQAASASASTLTVMDFNGQFDVACPR
ncbi:calcium-binding protein [Antarcticirhabdus aurantiaca]|uniref:Calcium-binding protein n=1 Tax=Antarcticirhabdus aurantiaca TaxID=2606717 RepID=A0ACD4NJ74_9HYPH|nr:calcium-binding protein [Antarcticirhabdus aurantiaca]WAJ26943.1 calcium-binding protein [Jeongeuplla avenae]